MREPPLVDIVDKMEALAPLSLDDEKVGGGGDKKSENDCPEERETHNL